MAEQGYPYKHLWGLDDSDTEVADTSAKADEEIMIDTPNYKGPCRRTKGNRPDIHPRRRYSDLLAELDPRFSTPLPKTPLGHAVEDVRNLTIELNEIYARHIDTLKKAVQPVVDQAVISGDMAAEIAASALKRYIDSVSRDNPLRNDVVEIGIVTLMKLLESSFEAPNMRYKSAISFEQLVDRKLGQRWKPRPLAEQPPETPESDVA